MSDYGHLNGRSSKPSDYHPKLQALLDPYMNPSRLDPVLQLVQAMGGDIRHGSSLIAGRDEGWPDNIRVGLGYGVGELGLLYVTASDSGYGFSLYSTRPHNQQRHPEIVSRLVERLPSLGKSYDTPAALCQGFIDLVREEVEALRLEGSSYTADKLEGTLNTAHQKVFGRPPAQRPTVRLSPTIQEMTNRHGLKS